MTRGLSERLDAHLENRGGPAMPFQDFREFLDALRKRG
jgi:formate hydrogenlyase subunit 4